MEDYAARLKIMGVNTIDLADLELLLDASRRRYPGTLLLRFFFRRRSPAATPYPRPPSPQDDS
jgi:hypothetical protein